MTKYIQPGDILDFTAPTGGVVVGVPLLIGAFFVVPLITAAEDETFSGSVGGVHEFTAATHATTQAASAGDPAYWDDTAKKITKTASGNRLVGAFAEDKVSTVALAAVSIWPRAAAPATAIANLALAAVTGVDGTGSNAASKADVDARFASLVTKVNAIIAALAAGGVALSS